MAKALYRKYRPQKFEDVLGQDKVVKVLRNQVISSQISHAYLFAGERGSGKTTCAKIFAKAINCLNPQNGSPCGVCKNCKSIDEESTMDVVEMDAASNRRIDDIRSLKETVIYPPNNLKYKVYIIDEAHMITREAFNALLKIMEEPPSHLVFILATTEKDKIPKTILSRVQNFEFSKIDRLDIIKQIDIILSDYKIKMENEAKDLIVTKANGAMRDALSILDQVLSIDSNTITLKDVESILGSVENKSIDLLVDKIITLNQKDALDILFSLRNDNKDDLSIVDSLTQYLRDIMIYKTSENKKYISSLDFLENIKDKASKISNNTIISYLEVINDYSNRMRRSLNTSLLMEMLLLRLINLKDEKNIESRIENLERQIPNNSIDLINNLVEEKISSLNIFSNKDNPTIKSDDKFLEKKEDFESKSSKVEKKTEEEVSSEVVNDKLLEKKQEEKIKKRLKKECSPLVSAFMDLEDFNYDIIDGKFIIYYTSSSFMMSLEASKDKIRSIVKDVTGLDFIVEVKDIDKKKSIKNNSIEESNYKKEDLPSVLDKLEKVFGKDLVIEE